MGPELFGVGFAEAVLVLVIMLIVVGPQRMPQVAREAGRWYRIARRYTAEITADVRSGLDEIEQEVKAETDDLQSIREIGDELETDLQETQANLRETEAELKQTEAELASATSGAERGDDDASPAAATRSDGGDPAADPAAQVDQSATADDDARSGSSDA